MNPLQVGITGGIGSGKSLVCRIFTSLGVPVYDADSQAKKLMTTDALLIQQIKDEFGNQAYRQDGSLDRAHISQSAFGNQKKLEKLNALVHPRVAHDFQLWLTSHKNYKYVIREAALLYETGIYKSIDKMIVVSSPETLRVKRVLTRDPQRSEDEIKAIMKNQWPEEEKLKQADHIIHNDEERMVIPQVLTLHALFSA